MITEAGVLFPPFVCLKFAIRVRAQFLLQTPDPNVNLPHLIHSITTLDSRPNSAQETSWFFPSRHLGSGQIRSCSRIAPYLAGQVCHAVAATGAGCGWHSSGWAWGSTLPPPVLPRGSRRIQTTVGGRKRLWGAWGHLSSYLLFPSFGRGPTRQPHWKTRLFL